MSAIKYPVQHRMLMFWLDQANQIADAAHQRMCTKFTLEMPHFRFFVDTINKYFDDHYESCMVIHYGINTCDDIHIIDSGFYRYADNFELEHQLLNNLFEPTQIQSKLDMITSKHYILNDRDAAITDAIHVFSSQEELELKMYLSGDKKYL